MNDFFSSVSPNRTLQVDPDIIVAYHRVDRERVDRERLDRPDRELSAKGALHDEGVPPPGELVAVMVATGRKWVSTGTRVARFGGWTFEMGPDEEQIALLGDPKALATATDLELRIFALDADYGDAVGPAASQPVASRASASRLTKWSPVREADRVLSDGKRGLRIDYTAGRLSMEWWHVARSSVFFEMDALRRKSPRPFMRCVLTLDGAGPTGPGDKGWYQADSTTFTPLGT